MPTIRVSGGGAAPKIIIPQSSLPVTLSFENLTSLPILVTITPVQPELLAGQPNPFLVDGQTTEVRTVVAGTTPNQWTMKAGTLSPPSTTRTGDIEITP